MRPSVERIQFSRKTWQAVTEHALKELSFRELDGTPYRIENLRPFFFEDEIEERFGRQIWLFESTSIGGTKGRRVDYGCLEFVVEYGLLELVNSYWFDSEPQREQWLTDRTQVPAEEPPLSRWTLLWVGLAMAGIASLAAIWTVSLLRYLNAG